MILEMFSLSKWQRILKWGLLSEKWVLEKKPKESLHNLLLEAQIRRSNYSQNTLKKSEVGFTDSFSWEARNRDEIIKVRSVEEPVMQHSESVNRTLQGSWYWGSHASKNTTSLDLKEQRRLSKRRLSIPHSFSRKQQANKMTQLWKHASYVLCKKTLEMNWKFLKSEPYIK